MAKQKTTTPAPPAAAAKEPSKTPIEINGQTYNLCFDLRQLADAEKHFRREGHEVRLMFALPELTFDAIREAFPCLVRTHHPELGWEQAQELVTIQSAYPIAIAIQQAFDAADVKVAPIGQG